MIVTDHDRQGTVREKGAGPGSLMVVGGWVVEMRDLF